MKIWGGGFSPPAPLPTPLPYPCAAVQVVPRANYAT